MKGLLTLAFISVLLNVCHAYFWIKGNKLMDSKGNEFIARGINTANADNDFYHSPATYYDGIVKTGANCIRIQWLIESEMSGKKLDDGHLKTAIQTAIDKNLIPILELWTYTGDQVFQLKIEFHIQIRISPKNRISHKNSNFTYKFEFLFNLIYLMFCLFLCTF